MSVETLLNNFFQTFYIIRAFSFHHFMIIALSIYTLVNYHIQSYVLFAMLITIQVSLIPQPRCYQGVFSVPCCNVEFSSFLFILFHYLLLFTFLWTNQLVQPSLEQTIYKIQAGMCFMEISISLCIMVSTLMKGIYTYY